MESRPDASGTVVYTTEPLVDEDSDPELSISEEESGDEFGPQPLKATDTTAPPQPPQPSEGFAKAKFLPDGVDDDDDDEDKDEEGDEDEEDEFGPQPLKTSEENKDGPPQGYTKARFLPEGVDDDSDDDGKDDGQEEKKRETEKEEEEQRLPLAEDAELRGHSKAISALAVDTGGARVLSGSHDTTVRMWDFAGMDRRLQSFREVVPEDGCPLTALDFDHTRASRLFVAAANTARPRLYTRDGRLLAAFAKGDVYIHDMARTAGHVQSVTDVRFSPVDDGTLLSGALDGTLRLWAADTAHERQRAVIKARTAAQRVRAAVARVAWAPDGRTVAGAVALERAVQLWPSAGPYHRPCAVLADACAPDAAVDSVAFFRDGWRVATRGGPGDDAVRLWDLRRAAQPLATRRGLGGSARDAPNVPVDCALSPDERLLATGAADRLVLLRTDGPNLLAPVSVGDSGGDNDGGDGGVVGRRVGTSGSSVLKVCWHARLGQVLVGTADGVVHDLYDSAVSTRGALLAVGRAAPRADPGESVRPQFVFTPVDDDPLRREVPIAKQLRLARKREILERVRNHEAPARKNPRLPPAVPGAGGLLATSNTQYLLRRTGLVVPEVEDDPREALLRYDARARANPYYFGPPPEQQLQQQQQQQGEHDEK